MFSTKGIVLRKSEYGEAGACFTVYTKDFGKLRLFASGIKKESSKLKGHLEPFTFSEINFVCGKNGERLTGALMLDHFSLLKEDYEKSAAACRIADLMDKSILPGEKDDAVWVFLKKFFCSLNGNKFSHQELDAFCHFFGAGLSDILGYGPR